MPQAQTLIKTRWQTLTAQLDNGAPTARSDSIASDELMVVDFIALTANPYVPCICTLYHSDTHYITQANDGGLDNFEGELEVPGGEWLTFVWSGVTGISTLTARLHYSLYQLSTVSIDQSLSSWRGVR